MAEANKLRTVMEAEAEAEAIKIRGDAEAFAIQAKAKAEAEQMAKKAAAWNEYKSAAMIDMMLDTLPKVIYINTSFVTWLLPYDSQSRLINRISCVFHELDRRRSGSSALASEENNDGVERQRHDRRWEIDRGGPEHRVTSPGAREDHDRRGRR